MNLVNYVYLATILFAIGGATVLAVTAASMIVDDKLVQDVLGEDLHMPLLILLSIVGLIIVLAPGVVRWRRQRGEARAASSRQASSHHPL